MLKNLWNSRSLKRVSSSRGIQHLISTFSATGRTGDLGETQPLGQLYSRFYSDGSRNSKWGDAPGRTVRQRRIASEVREAITEAMQLGPCQNPILQRCGFEIQKVKMSSDLRTAHVLWRALPGMEKTAEKAALSRIKLLRCLVFERLNLPFSPAIKFQEDKPSEEILALDEAFAKIKRSEIEDQSERESEQEKDNTPPTN